MKLPIKIGLMFFLVLILCIPLLMVSGLSSERRSYKNDVIDEIAAGFARPQRITTPYLVFSYDWPVSGGVEKHEYYIPAQKIALDGALRIERKARRIYSTAVYVGDFNITGSIQLSTSQIALLSKPNVHGLQARLQMAVSDSKGFRGVATLELDGEAIDFRMRKDSYNVELFVDMDMERLLAGEAMDFAVQLPLNGSSRLTFLPSGLENDIRIAGNWPHPSFTNNLLPSERVVTAEGFTAQWQPSWLTGLILDREGLLVQGYSNNPFSSNYGDNFGVELLELVDSYSLVDRSIKYGFLIICLTFVVIFMLEVLYKAQIHPIQYGLVGSALVVFFMLLLSLSEHIAFGLSYLVSALACIGLITFYLYFSLKNVKSTAIFSVFLAVLYTVLYLLLNISDYALLIGSVLMFAILAVIMVSTRKINWYKLNETR